MVKNLPANAEDIDLIPDPGRSRQAGSKLVQKECQGCILSLCLFSFYAEYIM